MTPAELSPVSARNNEPRTGPSFEGGSSSFSIFREEFSGRVACPVRREPHRGHIAIRSQSRVSQAHSPIEAGYANLAREISPFLSSARRERTEAALIMRSFRAHVSELRLPRCERLFFASKLQIIDNVDARLLRAVRNAHAPAGEKDASRGSAISQKRQQTESEYVKNCRNSVPSIAASKEDASNDTFHFILPSSRPSARIVLPFPPRINALIKLTPQLMIRGYHGLEKEGAESQDETMPGRIAGAGNHQRLIASIGRICRNCYGGPGNIRHRKG